MILVWIVQFPQIKEIGRFFGRGVPPSAPGISAPGISAPIGAEVPVAEIPGAEGPTHYLWTIF